MTASKTGDPRVVLECTVTDVTALWDAAAVYAANQFAMTGEDVAETIGLRDDPDLAACVSMLLDTLTRLSGVFESIMVNASVQKTPPAMGIVVTSRATLRGTCGIGDQRRTGVIHAA